MCAIYVVIIEGDEEEEEEYELEDDEEGPLDIEYVEVRHCSRCDLWCGVDRLADVMTCDRTLTRATRRRIWRS